MPQAHRGTDANRPVPRLLHGHLGQPSAPHRRGIPTVRKGDGAERVGENGNSERRPVTGRRGPPTRSDPTRKGADVRRGLTGEQASRGRLFGEVSRCSLASHGRKTTSLPRGPPSPGPPWQSRADGGTNVARAPPRTPPGGRSQPSSSGLGAPRPTPAWRADARRRTTRANPPPGAMAWGPTRLQPGASGGKRA